MTVVEFCSEKGPALRAHLLAERTRLQTSINQAAAAGSMGEVDELRPQLDDVNDDLAFLETEELKNLVAANIRLPQLPDDFAEILRRGEANLANWTRLQQSVQTAIDVAGDLADGVSTLAQLFLKYGKFLL